MLTVFVALHPAVQAVLILSVATVSILTAWRALACLPQLPEAVQWGLLVAVVLVALAALR